MPGEQTRMLWCLVDGDHAPFSVTVYDSHNIDHLKDIIKGKKSRLLFKEDASSLELWKLIDPEPVEPEDTLAQRIRSRGDVKTFAKQLTATQKVSKLYTDDPLEDHIHILVKVKPTTSRKRSRSPAEEDGHTARPKRTDDADCSSDQWLVELHSKIWDRRDLSSELYHKVEVTVAHYDALQERLRKLHPDRDSSNYIASANNVLSIKLESLHSYQPIPSSPSPFVQRAHSSNEQILGENDKDLEESDGDDTELSSFLPATLEFLDLSSLGLQKRPPRLPLPLFLRQEYSLISRLLKELPTNSSGSVIVSGQPGTGKTAFLHLKIIESMISGRAFLYQTVNGVVYHVSQKVTKIESWSSDEPIVAFVDADSGSSMPRSFLRCSSVQIIAASSPGGTEQSWLKQGDSLAFVATLRADLWSPGELFLTGIFLHPQDLTFMRLKESVSYFGFNPRRCFGASQSENNLLQLTQAIEHKVRSIPLKDDILTLLNAAYGRLLGGAGIGAVSPWALDVLLKEYETRHADAVADFYSSIAGMPYAGSLRGRLFERQVLKYFDTLHGPHDFSIRSLASSTVSKWPYPGPAERVTFQSQSFTPSLKSAVEAKQPRHLVPSDPNFPAVDSILYDPTGVLICIQVTIKDKHPIAVSGLKHIQGWLKYQTPLADLRPSTSGNHWDLIFVVPDTVAPAFRLQNFEGDTNKCEWAKKVDQYVLGIEEDILWRKAMKTS